jgi:hypothetical protein
MATKNNPGAFDCYANAEPDEPMFVLLGRDPSAWLLVLLWAKVREMRPGADPAKLEEARQCARALRAWAIDKGKAEGIKLVQETVGALLRTVGVSALNLAWPSSWSTIFEDQLSR